MIRHSLYLLAAVACLATAPATAQEPASQAPAVAQPVPLAGPRLEPGYRSFQPKLAHEQESLAMAAAADRTVITISTLGIVLLIVLLILLVT
jgi:hypothetical protein